MNEKALVKVLVDLKREQKELRELVELLVERTEFLYEELEKKKNA